MESPLVAKLDEMAFSPENERWIIDKIDTSIRKALERITLPSGFKKALYVLREYNILAVNFTIIVTLAIFAATQWSAANRRLADDAVSHTKTDDRLKGVEEKLTTLRTLIVSSQPTRKQNQDAAKELLVEARHRSIPAIPQPAVEQAGKSFLSAASEDHEAWKVALDFVSYRSTLNAPDMPGDKQLPVSAGHGTWFLSPKVPGKPFPMVFRSDMSSPVESSAWVAPLARIPITAPQPGPAWVAYVGGALSLDLMYMRHVVLKDVEVHYNGTPLELQDTLFINCTFVIDNSPNGRELGNKILSASRVNFTTGVPAG
jgi:hypothetical protein